MNELLTTFKKYFGLTEVFSKAVAKRYGEQAYSFLDPRLMEVLIWLREGIGLPMYINTDSMQQRGFRENTCAMVADYTAKGKTYCSSHCLGKGVDINVSGNKMSAKDMREWVRINIESCPHPIRMEKDVTWLHIDVMNMDDTNKLYEFKA